MQPAAPPVALFNIERDIPQEPPTSVFCAHPTARRAAYFDYQNPLRRANRVPELRDLEAVQWWPFAAPDE